MSKLDMPTEGIDREPAADEAAHGPPEGGRNPAAALLLRPFQRFFELEASSGILLLLAAVVALVWANSPFAESYYRLWEIHFAVGLGEFALDKPLHLWINDGLMAIFFFVVGLEIKREVLIGELASLRRALLPICAAVGGMVVPAALYVALNTAGEGARGWGIPMATDIAFAVGVLTVLGSRVPTALKVFLTALAIVDDLGAVLVIAFFYTGELYVPGLVVAAVVFVVLAALGRTGVRSMLLYGLLGLVLWVAFLKSGVHATIAGVLLALTIPARERLNPVQFLDRARRLVGEFGEDVPRRSADLTSDQRDSVHTLHSLAVDAEAPLSRLEHALHPWVAFFIMPVFALANAGVSLEGIGEALASPVSMGIILGLFVGKQIGVFGAAWLAAKTGLADPPTGATWRQVYGTSLLCGIGFTMSLFIASLAFEGNPVYLTQAKAGILAASLISGVGGWLLLASSRPASPVHAA